MSNYPGFWHFMTAEEQQHWQQMNNAREEAQRRERIAQQEKESVQQQAKQAKVEYAKSIRQACEDLKELYQAEREEVTEKQLAWQWIEEQGQWEAFVEWSNLQRED